MAVSLSWSDVALPEDLLLRAMLFGTKWDATSISFTFPADRGIYQADHPYLRDGATYETLSETMQRAVEGILAGSSTLPGGPLSAITPVAGFTLLQFENAGGADATLRFGVSTAGPEVLNTATGEFPGYGTKYPDDAIGRDGEIWFSVNQPYDQVALGNFGYQAGFIHEIGHSLGLKHPFQALEVNPVVLPEERDSGEFTVMTYRSFVGASIEGGTTNEEFGFPQSWMMYDIAGLQYLYGANYAFRAGDTTYRWSPDTGETFVDGVSQGVPGENRIFLTIWDGGGTDTYDLSNYQSDLHLDLAPGGWSVLAEEQRANLNYYGKAPVLAGGNVYNALLFGEDPRSLIENAIGGGGDDSIRGNIAANRLEGGAGDDVLAGGAGDDVLEGGEGEDRAAFDAVDALTATWSYDAGTGQGSIASATSGTDSLISVEALEFGGLAYGYDTLREEGTEAADRLETDAAGSILSGLGGADTLGGQQGQDIIGGGEGDDSVAGGGGRDILLGQAGRDTLLGQDGDDTLLGGEGDDLVRDGAGQDEAHGDAGEDRLLAQAGEDRLYGGEGNDTLFGGADADRIQGGSGRDLLLGAAGADRLFGDAGEDKLYGGAGDDELDGGTEDDILVGGEGVDQLSGDQGADRLWGDAGDDSLSGDGGDDSLWGGAGNDMIAGGAGDDLLRGDAGADIFLLAAEEEGAAILDFALGEDRLDLSAWEIADYGALIASFLSEDADGVRIAVEEAGEVVLVGLRAEMLQAGDFIFYGV